MPALAATPCQNGAAAFRTHANAKPVRLAPPTPIWLERSLHEIHTPEKKPPLRDPPRARTQAERLRSETRYPNFPADRCQPQPVRSDLSPRTPERQYPPECVPIFSCRPPPHMLDYAPRPVDKDDFFPAGWGPSYGELSTFVDNSVEIAPNSPLRLQRSKWIVYL